MKNFYQKVIFFTLALFLILGISGCGQKPATNTNTNDNSKQNVNQNKNLPITNHEQVATAQSTIIPPEKTDCEDEMDVECWNTYRNEEWGFEVSFPEKFYLYDCSKLSSTNIVKLSDKKEDDCYEKNLRIGIYHSREKDIEKKEEFEEYSKKSFKIGEIAVEQMISTQEIRGGEGEKIEAEPKVKIIETFVPHENEFINISYFELIDIKKDVPGILKIEQDYTGVYNQLINSFKFLD